jgi:hypothetical protein
MQSRLSRTEWTNQQLRFVPPREQLPIRLSDCAGAEEIAAAIAAVRQVWRNLNRHIREAGSDEDAALTAQWDAADRRRVGWILSSLRKGELPNRNDVERLLEGAAGEQILSLYARCEAAQAAAIEQLRLSWVPPPVDDAAWEEHLRFLVAHEFRRCGRDWLFPNERRLSPEQQMR